VAFESTDGKEAFVAIYPLSGTSSFIRITYGGNNRYPIWSADGKHVVFQSDRDGDPAVFWQPIDGGAAERLTRPSPGASHVPESWCPVQDVLLFSETDRSTTTLRTLTLRDRKSTVFGDVHSTLGPTDAVFSPDGRWVAYQAGDDRSSTEGTVFVQPFPPSGTKYQIAKGGRPLWTPDGKELFYIPGPGQLRVVTVATRPTFTFTDPVAVPRGFGTANPTMVRTFDITREGHFIAFRDPVTGPGGASEITQVRVILNWLEELKQRVPTR
jgi:Tol biopolymer transport system component